VKSNFHYYHILDASISRDADVNPTSVAVSTLAYQVLMNNLISNFNLVVIIFHMIYYIMKHFPFLDAFIINQYMIYYVLEHFNLQFI
jgi:hypothetical protein